MLRLLLALAAVTAPTAAFAHPGGPGAHGFPEGFLHPLGGLDHVLAMVAVGVLAARIGGRALWLVPLSFVGMMAVGGGLGMAGVSVPAVEGGIALSVLVLGLVLALGLTPPATAAMALVGFFAVFHGCAHGAEMPETASGLAYGAGFVLATLLLHAAGLVLGLALGRSKPAVAGRAAQVAGGAMSVAGAVLLVGAL